MARNITTSQKRAQWLVFGWCGWWWWPEEGPTTENEWSCSFSGVVGGGGGGQMKVQRPLPKNEPSSSFSGWCWQEEGPTLENERLCSFSRGVGGGVGQRKVQPPKTSAMAHFRGGRWVVDVVVDEKGSTCPKTSTHAHFREVWVVVLARGRYNP